VPKRAVNAEAALLQSGFTAAAAALARDFEPIDDWRGSGLYRLQVAANLLRRLELRRRSRPAGRGRGAMSVHTSQRHDSALKHVTGQALYIDDLPEPAGTLHAALILSPVAAGRLRKLDLAPAASAPAVVTVLGPSDIPGKNDVAPVGQNEPLFAFDQIDYAGQPLAMVVAETLDAA